jgi:hypothetical protein
MNWMAPKELSDVTLAQTVLSKKMLDGYLHLLRFDSDKKSRVSTVLKRLTVHNDAQVSGVVFIVMGDQAGKGSEDEESGLADMEEKKKLGLVEGVRDLDGPSNPFYCEIYDVSVPKIDKDHYQTRDGVVQWPAAAPKIKKTVAKVKVERVAEDRFLVSGPALDEVYRPQVDNRPREPALDYQPQVERSPDEGYRGNDFEIVERIRQNLAAKTLAEAEAHVKAMKEDLALQEARVEARQGRLAEEETRLANEEVRLKKRDAEYVKENELLKNAEAKQREGAANARYVNSQLSEDEAEQKRRRAALDANDRDLATLAGGEIKEAHAEIAHLKAALGVANALLDSNGAAAQVEQCKLEVRATKCEMLQLEKEKDLKYQSLVNSHSLELAEKDRILGQQMLEFRESERQFWKAGYKKMEAKFKAANAGLEARLKTEMETREKMVEERLAALGGDLQQVRSKLSKFKGMEKLMNDEKEKAAVELDKQKTQVIVLETIEKRDTTEYKKLQAAKDSQQQEYQSLQLKHNTVEKKIKELTAAVADKNLPTNDAYALYLRSDNRRLEAAVADAKENVEKLTGLCKAKGASWEEIGEAVSVECWFIVVLS